MTDEIRISDLKDLVLIRNALITSIEVQRSNNQTPHFRNYGLLNELLYAIAHWKK